MGLIENFPPDVFKAMLDYGEQLLANCQAVCDHDWTQSMFSLVADSPVINTPHGNEKRYHTAQCVKCYKRGYYDIVTHGYVEHF